MTTPNSLADRYRICSRLRERCLAAFDYADAALHRQFQMFGQRYGGI
jgi:hypothetical protein